MNVANCDWRTPRCSSSSDLREALEQPLPAAEHDRRDDDRQLVHEARLERLADDVRPAHDVHVLVAGRLARPLDGLLDAGRRT